MIFGSTKMEIYKKSCSFDSESNIIFILRFYLILDPGNMSIIFHLSTKWKIKYNINLKSGCTMQPTTQVILFFKTVLIVWLAGNYSCVNTSHYRLMVQSSETELRLQALFLFALEGLHESLRQDLLCRMQGKHQHALFYSGGRTAEENKELERQRKYRERE